MRAATGERGVAVIVSPVIPRSATVRPSQPENALLGEREEVDDFVRFLT